MHVHVHGHGHGHGHEHEHGQGQAQAQAQAQGDVSHACPNVQVGMEGPRTRPGRRVPPRCDRSCPGACVQSTMLGVCVESCSEV